MTNSQRTGRHAAAAPIKPMAAGAVTAGAATAGLLFSVAVPSAVGSEEQVDASERITLADQPVEETATEFTVQTDGAEDFALDEVTVTAEAPVVEEQVVEEAVEAEATTATVEEAPVAEETTAAATTQTQAPTATTQTQAPAATTQTQTQAATTTTTTAPAATSGRGSTVVAVARSYAGAPYVWGGTSPAGWDCVGFVNYVYAQSGVGVRLSSSAYPNVGYVVSASQAQPGDLMWWPGHLGIYTGNGMHIAAWNPSMGTQEAAVWGSPVYFRVF